MSLGIFLQGLGVGAGLIIAIGAQNTFVLSQGIRREHHLLIASLCAVLDLLLISAGVYGMGALLEQQPQLLQLATWGGALFLFLYGLRAFRSALRKERMSVAPRRRLSTGGAVLVTLALTLLNPHVYIDTVLLLGSIGGRHPLESRWLFVLGASLASALWFCGLSLGAARLAPLFQQPRAWRWLDSMVGMTMWGVGSSLLLSS